VRLEWLALLRRLAFDHGGADHEVTDVPRRDLRRCLEGKGEDVGRLVDAAVLPVQGLALGLVDDADDELGGTEAAVEGSLRVLRQAGLGGDLLGVGCPLDLEPGRHLALLA
jgi:hypothetical protein